MSAPSTLTTPLNKGHTPSTALANELLPAALGPIIAHISPAFRLSVTSASDKVFALGGNNDTLWHSICPTGSGSFILSASIGNSSKNLSSL